MTPHGDGQPARPRHVRPADASLVRESENGLVLRTLVTGRQTGDALSLTWVQLDGVHRRLRSARTTRTYYVVEGAVDVEVDGQPPVRVQADEALVLPPGATYGLRGRGTYLVLNTPAFAEGDDEYVDGPAPQRT